MKFPCAKKEKKRERGRCEGDENLTCHEKDASERSPSNTIYDVSKATDAEHARYLSVHHGKCFQSTHSVQTVCPDEEFLPEI